VIDYRNPRRKIMKLKKLFTATAFVLLWAAYAMPALAQRFILIGTAGLVVSAGETSAWSAGYGPTFTFNPKTGLLSQIANSPVLNNISAGGGSAFQNDEVWGIDNLGNTQRWNSTSQSFGVVTGHAMLSVTVGAGYTSCHQYEVWGIDNVGQAWRYNFCNNDWDSFGGDFNGIATGGGEVWGLNNFGNPMLFNPTTQQFGLLPGSFAGIDVGAGGVWAVEEGGLPYQFDPATQSWDQVGGGSSYASNSFVAGKEGVFASYSYNDIYAAIYRLNVSFGTWSSVTSYDQQNFGLNLTDGSGGGAWGVDAWTSQNFVYITY
jgi:hypothetical protein